MNVTATDPKRRALGKGPRFASSPVSRLRMHLTPRAAGLGRFRSTRSTTILSRHAPRSMKNNWPSLLHPSPRTAWSSQFLVRPLAGWPVSGFIAGERRWRASKLAGKTTVPAILRQVSDEQAMEITIVEHSQRADLNPMEQARAFDRLSREFHMTQEQMAHRTGKDRATVSNFLRLLRLPSAVQARVETGDLTFGHARALLAFEHAEEMEKAAQRISTFSLSVRQTENYVQGLIDPSRKKKEPKPEPVVDPNVRDAQERLQRALGLKVTIEDHNGRGKVVIEYARLEDFDALMEQLAGQG